MSPFVNGSNLACLFTDPSRHRFLEGSAAEAVACKPGLAWDRKAHALKGQSELPTEYELDARELRAVCKLVWSSAALREASTT